MNQEHFAIIFIQALKKGLPRHRYILWYGVNKRKNTFSMTNCLQVNCFQLKINTYLSITN